MGNLLNTKKKSLVSQTENITHPMGTDEIEDHSIHSEPSTSKFLNEYKGMNGQDISNPSEERAEMHGSIGQEGKKMGMSDMTKGVL